MAVNPDTDFRAVLRSFAQAEQASGEPASQTPPQKDITYSFDFLSIHEPDADPTIVIERKSDTGEVNEITTMIAARRSGEDPWVWSRLFKAPPGEAVTVTTTISVAGTQTVVATPKRGATRPQLSGREKRIATIRVPAPSLALAINSTAVRDTATDSSYDGLDFANPGTAEIEAITRYVWRRLERGIGPAWFGPNGQEERFGFTALNETIAEVGFATDAGVEEAWAQLVSEKLTYNPYAGPGLTHLGDPAADADIFAKVNDPEDPVHPLVHACQHLCTLAGIFRGFGFTGTGFDASTVSAGVMKALGGTWVPTDPTTEEADPTLQIPVANAIDLGLQPGDSFLWSRKQTPQKIQGDHIAFFIRIHPDKRRAQFFDTGGAGVIAEVGTVSGASKNFEYPWSFKIWGPSTQDPDDPSKRVSVPFRGVGLFRQTPSLPKQLDRLRAMRPLGLARLVVRKRASPLNAEGLVFVSPMLRMHTADRAMNFSLARLAWSLRMMPGYQHLEGQWLIYNPVGWERSAGGKRKTNVELCRAMLDNPRSTRLDALIAMDPAFKADSDDEASAYDDYLSTHTLRLAAMMVNTRGLIDGHDYIKAPATASIDHLLPARDRLFPSQDLAIPDYFKGDFA